MSETFSSFEEGRKKAPPQTPHVKPKTERYPIEFFREVAEPMLLKYLQETSQICERFWWCAEKGGDLGEMGAALNGMGIDGFVELRSLPGQKLIMALQITCINPRGAHREELRDEKLKRWQTNPIHPVGDEAKYLGVERRTMVPIFIYHMNQNDVLNAWDKGESRDMSDRGSAEKAAVFLPHNPQYVLKEVLSVIRNSADQIPQLPGISQWEMAERRNIIKPYQEVFAAEEERLRRSLATAK